MTIAAVVVTYNRKELMKECLIALKNQSHKLDYIYIVDNHSLDGTYEFLSDKGLLGDNIVYNYLQNNIGGAGGFNYGMKKICTEKDVDWIWVMDDDTIPSEDALDKLLSKLEYITGKISFLASSVWGMEDQPMNVPKLSFHDYGNGYFDWYRYLEHACVRIDSATFVSLLINTKAVQKVGYPWAPFFVWGDDVEYTNRLTRYYGRAYFVGDSKVIHKRKISKNLSIHTEENIDRIKMYYYQYRNQLIIANEYFDKKEVVKQIYYSIKTCLKILIRCKKYKWVKIDTVIRGNFDFIFRKYNISDFKNRLPLN